MRFACWITKATGTYAEYVTLSAFSWQQRLRERASILRLCVHCSSCELSTICNEETGGDLLTLSNGMGSSLVMELNNA